MAHLSLNQMRISRSFCLELPAEPIQHSQRLPLYSRAGKVALILRLQDQGAGFQPKLILLLVLLCQVVPIHPIPRLARP